MPSLPNLWVASQQDVVRIRQGRIIKTTTTSIVIMAMPSLQRTALYSIIGLKWIYLANVLCRGVMEMSFVTVTVGLGGFHSLFDLSVIAKMYTQFMNLFF